MSEPSLDTELEQLRRERARLWEQLHEQRAAEREVEHLRSEIARMESSLSWRITKPLRLAKTYWRMLRRRLSSSD